MKKLFVFSMLAVMVLLPLMAEEITPEKVLSNSYVRIYSSEKEYEKYYCSDPDGISLSFSSQDFGIRRNLCIGGEIIAQTPHIGLNQMKVVCILDGTHSIDIPLGQKGENLWETNEGVLLDFSGLEPGNHTLEVYFEANFSGTLHYDPEYYKEPYKAVFNTYKSYVNADKNGDGQIKYNCFAKESENPDFNGHDFGEVTSLVFHPEFRTSLLTPDSVMFLYKRNSSQKTPIKIKLINVAEKGGETVSVWQMASSAGLDLGVENLSGGEYEFCVGYEIHLGGEIIDDPALNQYYIANYTVYDVLESVYFSGITINARDYDVSADLGNPSFDGTDLGQFDKLTIGAACRTIEAGTADYATLHYCISDGESHSIWQTMSLNEKREWIDGDSHHDRWKNAGDNPEIDISQFKGVCTIRLYYSATSEGSEFVPSGTVYDGSVAEPYSATFTKGVSNLSAITKSKICINGISYNVSDNSDDPDFVDADLGTFSTLTLNASCFSEDNTGHLADIFYRIKGPEQEDGKWVPLALDEKENFPTYSKWMFASDREVDLRDLKDGVCTLDVYFEVRKDDSGIGEREFGKVAAQSTVTDPVEGFYTAYFTKGDDTPLPITLVSFKAEVKNGVVQLQWQTASETNNAAFLIYRDGEVIASLDGAGTTSEPQSYRYTDNYVIPGVAYKYVLADVSLGGEEVLHADREIEVTVQSGNIGMDFSIGAAYPNPFNPVSIIPLNLGRSAQVTAVLYDLQGRRLAELQNGMMPAGSHDLKIDGARLATGIYFVHINVNNVINVQKIALMK